MDLDQLLRNPLVLGGAAAAVGLLVVVVVLVKRKGRRKKGPVVDDTRGRARSKLRDDLRNFRDDLKKALQTAGPVFRKIEVETEHTNVVGHWRKTLNHRISVRVPGFNGLKGTVRMLGYDAQSLIDLDAAWKKTGKMVADYNAGSLDASRTPIAFAKEFEKELQKIVLLANMCLQKYTS